MKLSVCLYPLFSSFLKLTLLHSQTQTNTNQTKPGTHTTTSLFITSSWSICMFNNLIFWSDIFYFWNMIIWLKGLFCFSLYCCLDLPLHAKRVLLFYGFVLSVHVWIMILFVDSTTFWCLSTYYDPVFFFFFCE